MNFRHKGWRWPWAAVVAFGLFLGVYLPSFGLLYLLHLLTPVWIPLVMLLTVLAASLWAWALSRARAPHASAATYGLCWPASTGAAAVWVALAVPVAGLVALAGHFAPPEPGPLGGLHLPAALLWLYFGAMAPLQEEWIFRGLIQTQAQRALGSYPDTDTAHSGAAIGASLIVAILFGAIHLAIGPVTAAGALLLGLLAGEARRRSGSLLPAVAIHAVFNIIAGDLLASMLR